MQLKRRIAVMLLLTTGLCAGAASTTPAPATGDAAKAALTRFVSALVANQVQEALTQTYVSNEEARSKSELYLECLLRNNLFQRGMAEAFKDRVKVPATAISEQQKKELESAKVIVEGDTAQVGYDRQNFKLIREKGVWKVDVLKTFEPRLKHAAQAEWDAAATGVKIRTQVIAEAKSGKFNSPAEAYAEIRRRWTAAGVDDWPPGSKWESTISDMAWVKDYLDQFKTDTGKYPTTAEGLAPVEQRYGGKIRDGWDRAFIYTSPGKDGLAYDLLSAGFDGKPGTEDDISWNAGADQP